MTDKQKNCAHEPEPNLNVCRKCRLSARAYMIGDKAAPWLGILDSVRFATQSAKAHP